MGGRGSIRHRPSISLHRLEWLQSRSISTVKSAALAATTSWSKTEVASPAVASYPQPATAMNGLLAGWACPT